MFLILPRVRLQYGSSASKTSLDYVWSVCTCRNASCLSKFVGLSFHSLFGWSCWFVAHNEIRSHNEISFGLCFGAHDLFLNCKGPKLEPKTGPKIGPKIGCQNAIRGANFFSKTRTRTRRHDLQSVLRSYFIVRNKPTTSTKQGMET